MMIAEEVATFLQNSQGSLLSEALEEAQRRRQAQFDIVDEVQGLDEAELDRFLLTQDEVRVKERVWVELNRDYLEAIAGLCLLGSLSVSEGCVDVTVYSKG
jgi:transcription factor IIIB subunit 2